MPCPNQIECDCTGGLFTYNAGTNNNPDDDIIDEIIGVLDGLRWEIPCINPLGGNCSCVSPIDQITVLQGSSSVIYQCTLRFRGVVEPKDYTGGTNDGEFFQIGGTPAESDSNRYALVISNPPQTYYLNRFWEGADDYMNAIDYTAVVPIAGGATVILNAVTIDDIQHANGGNLVIPDVPPDPDPFDGQFIQMDVIGVVAS